jgi:hypothetical protein
MSNYLSVRMNVPLGTIFHSRVVKLVFDTKSDYYVYSCYTNPRNSFPNTYVEGIYAPPKWHPIDMIQRLSIQRSISTGTSLASVPD